MGTLLIFASLGLQTLAAPRASPVELAKRAAVSPQVASAQLLANVTDPAITRDSCGSCKIGDRALWTCRDTETWNGTEGVLPLITNTASWTDFNSDGTPAIITNGPVGADSTGSNPILLMYGGDPTTLPAFFPVLSDECPESGSCTDGTRWAIWPNSPPMVISDETGSGGTATAYTWIPKAHLNFLTALIQEPARTLYKLTYTPTSDNDTLPSVSVVNENFWTQGQIGYGDYGNVVMNGTAYLYGQTDAGKGTALAKVPVGSVEDTTQYQYYVNGAWTSTMPGINDTSAIIANAGAGGQGTFYYSGYFDSYIWIGQQADSNVADFYITSAPDPEGPWIEPYQFYAGANGDNPIAVSIALPKSLTCTDSSRQHRADIHCRQIQHYSNQQIKMASILHGRSNSRL